MSALITGEDLVALAKGLISAKKQQAACSIDLTVSSISRISTGGSLDFGGSEFQEAAATILVPKKKADDEPYGWWNLTQGNYLIRFNERIDPPQGTAVMIVPHERLIAAGGSHPAIVVDRISEDVSVLLQVGVEGLSIKENARVSKAVAWGGR